MKAGDRSTYWSSSSVYQTCPWKSLTKNWNRFTSSMHALDESLNRFLVWKKITLEKYFRTPLKGLKNLSPRCNLMIIVFSKNGKKCCSCRAVKSRKQGFFWALIESYRLPAAETDAEPFSPENFDDLDRGCGSSYFSGDFWAGNSGNLPCTWSQLVGFDQIERYEAVDRREKPHLKTCWNRSDATVQLLYNCKYVLVCVHQLFRPIARRSMYSSQYSISIGCITVHKLTCRGVHSDALQLQHFTYKTNKLTNHMGV